MTNNNNSVPLKLRHRGTIQAMMLPIALVIVTLSGTLYLETRSVIRANSTYILLCICLSGIFHVVYSYVSTALVLTQISVVSHAVANIMKRLLVVLLLYTFSQRTATTWNFMGLLVCTLGLLVYAWDKSKTQQISKDRDGPAIRITRRWVTIAISILGALSIIMSLTLLKVDSHGHVGNFKSNVVISELYFRSLNSPHNELKTFEPGGLQKPHQTQLLPTEEDLPSPSLQNVLGILNLPVKQNIKNVNFISQRLSTSNGVIREARRLHFDIIGRELQKFKYAFLIGIAAFENKGDPAITVGEIYFLARMNIEIKYYCSWCAGDRLKKARKLAEKFNPDELVILLQGGGNIIGYPSYDHMRFSVLKLFPPFKILLFPQSIRVINWTDPHVNRTARIYCCNSNMTMVLRDPLSFDIAKKLYKGTTRLIMAPDMAFQIGHVQRFMSPVFDVMWIKRRDHETPGYLVPKHVPDNLRVHVSDWWKWLTPSAGSTLEKAFYIASNGLFFLQRGRVVITDRLHGHILSVLMDIPHVLIDNKAKKLSSYHNAWTRSLNNTVITDDPSKALGLAIELLNKYNNTLPPVVPFLNLRQDFSDPLNGFTDTGYP